MFRVGSLTELLKILKSSTFSKSTKWVICLIIKVLKEKYRIHITLEAETKRERERELKQKELNHKSCHYFSPNESNFLN